MFILGDDFNLFNPCKCLNDERFAPVVVEESDEKILGKLKMMKLMKMQNKTHS